MSITGRWSADLASSVVANCCPSRPVSAPFCCALIRESDPEFSGDAYDPCSAAAAYDVQAFFTVMGVVRDGAHAYRDVCCILLRATKVFIKRLGLEVLFLLVKEHVVKHSPQQAIPVPRLHAPHLAPAPPRHGIEIFAVPAMQALRNHLLSPQLPDRWHWLDLLI